MATAETPPARDAEAVYRDVRRFTKWGRDCAAGMIYGGLAVGFGLILTGTAIRREVYVPLLVLYGGLLLANAYFWSRAMHAVGRAKFLNVMNALLPPLLIILAGLARTSGHWPIKAYSGQWWQIVALAIFIGLLGAYRRRRAEDALDQLEDVRRSYS